MDTDSEGEALQLRKVHELPWKPAVQPEVASGLLATRTGILGGHSTGGRALRQRGGVSEVVRKARCCKVKEVVVAVGRA